MKRFTFSVPQNILFGEGVLKELPGANPDTGRHRSQYFLRHGRKSICRDCGTGSGSI